MKRREFLMTAVAAAGLASTRRGWAQSADPAKRARISIMTLNFSSMLKLPGQPDSPTRTLEIFDIPQMYADTYGVHSIEFQHSHIPSTETAYLKELRGQIEKRKSRMTQINLEFGPMNISATDPVLRVQAIDLTKRWVDHAAVLGCPRVMINQGQLNQDSKHHAIATLKTMGEYAKSKGVMVSAETRGGGGGRGAAPGRAGAAPAAGGAPAPPAPPPPAAPTGPPAWILLKEVIESSGTYSNVDIGNVGAMNQEEIHAAILGLLPTSSGNMHIKVRPQWDLATAIKYTVGIGYKGLYSIEVSGHDNVRAVYNTILANI